MKNTYYYKTPLGIISITEDGSALTNVGFHPEVIAVNEILMPKTTMSDTTILETPLIKESSKQLFQYFEGKRMVFDLPLSPKGTPFQKSIWKVLQTIPYGEAWSYKKVAEQIGNPKASRAVGMANHNNPLPIIIPCHRVIGANGKMVGYAGGIDLKVKLLELEKYKI